MGYLTIQEVMEFTGLSRQTIMAYLKDGKLTGRKTGDATSPWLIPADEVERLRLDQVRKFKEKLKSISEPVNV